MAGPPWLPGWRMRAPGPGPVLGRLSAMLPGMPSSCPQCGSAVCRSRTGRRRPYGLPPRIDLPGIERDDRKQRLGKGLPGLGECWRNGREDGHACLDGRGERIAQAAAIALEMAELAQHDEVAAHRNVSLHGSGRGERAGARQMASLRAHAEILEDLEPLIVGEADQIAGSAGAIR